MFDNDGRGVIDQYVSTGSVVDHVCDEDVADEDEFLEF